MTSKDKVEVVRAINEIKCRYYGYLSETYKDTLTGLQKAIDAVMELPVDDTPPQPQTVTYVFSRDPDPDVDVAKYGVQHRIPTEYAPVDAAEQMLNKGSTMPVVNCDLDQTIELIHCTNTAGALDKVYLVHNGKVTRVVQVI